MHIKRGVSAQNRTRYMLYTPLPLHKLIIKTNQLHKKLRIHSLLSIFYFWFFFHYRPLNQQELSAFKWYFTAVSVCITYALSWVRGRPEYIVACQRSLMEGWRKWMSEKGGWGYSLSAKQEVAQHLFLGIQGGSEWPAVCLRVRLHAKKSCIQADNVTFLPVSQFFEIWKQLYCITQSFHLLSLQLKYLKTIWGETNVGLISARG